INSIATAYSYRSMSDTHGTGAPTSCTPSSHDYTKPALVVVVVVMATVSGAMSVVGVERLIRGRFTLFSMVRFLLRSTFVLILPLLSSMSRDTVHRPSVLFVLLWMLLVELMRKKVSSMARSSGADGGAFSRATGGRFRLMGHCDEATKLAWIGWLIFQNTYYSDSKCGDHKVLAMFAVLWSLVVAKLLQRVFNEWKAQESLTAAGNTHLIAGYMQLVVDKEATAAAAAAAAAGTALARCKYVVMGEEKLVVHAVKKKKHDVVTTTITTPHCGYGVGTYPQHQSEQKHVNLLVDMAKCDEVVTVQKIKRKIKLPRWWCCCCFTVTGSRFTDYIYQLCFSFALFKLLRRRFEHYPMVEAGSQTSRQLLLEELLVGGAKKTFRVMRQELDFLDSYYDAGSPVAMSSPWLFIVNYFFSLVFVSTYLAAIIVVLVDVEYNMGTFKSHLPSPGLYIAVSILLVVTLVAVEFTDLLTNYILSNWFMVHLFCLQAGDGGGRVWRWVCKPAIWMFIAGRFLLFYSFQCMLRLSCRGVNVDKIKLKQVSILRVCEPVHKVLTWSPQVKLATEGQTAIVNFLEDVVRDSLKDDGNVAIVSMPKLSGLQPKKGVDDTATQVVLACHLATELLEMKHVVMVDKEAKKEKKKMKREDRRAHDLHRGVATALSRYCMYLVARSPELLPDNERWVADRYGDMRAFLDEAASRRRRRCCCCLRRRLWKCGCWRTFLMDDMVVDAAADPAAQAGVALFRKLHARTTTTEGGAVVVSAWKELADFWVRMVVYLAPSSDVEGHAMALADNGGDLITYLWAFCTHAGIIRDPNPSDKSLV
ncbi:Os07g0222200, partial [Oryza sativa Japonica Group]